MLPLICPTLDRLMLLCRVVKPTVDILSSPGFTTKQLAAAGSWLQLTERIVDAMLQEVDLILQDDAQTFQPFHL